MNDTQTTERVVTAYVTVAVRMTQTSDGSWEYEIDRSDDGEAGPHGDIFDYGVEEGDNDGYWFNDPDITELAGEHIDDELLKASVPEELAGFELFFGDATEADTWVTVLDILKGWAVTFNDEPEPVIIIDIAGHPSTDMIAIEVGTYDEVRARNAAIRYPNTLGPLDRIKPGSTRWIQYDEIRKLEIH